MKRAAEERQRRQDFGRGVTSVKLAEVIEKGESVERVAAALNMSHFTYRRAKSVVEAAEKAPERQAAGLRARNSFGRIFRSY